MGRVLVGAASWSERTLVHESGWYPRRSMKAAERIAYYCERFPIVEIDATARFPPTPDLARQWVERTPAGFTIDVQAWSLLTGAATLPDSLWPDLGDEVRAELRDRPRLYAGHLSKKGMDEAWARFRHALLPLVDANRLGVIVLRYPYWLKPGDTGRGLMAEARHQLADFRLAVELGNGHWLEGRECETTLAFLEDHEMSVVCVDSSFAPPVVASTSETAVLRLAGRDPDWPGNPYRYSGEELARWVAPIGELAASAAEVHVLLSNCWRDDAVVNAAELSALLA